MKLQKSFVLHTTKNKKLHVSSPHPHEVNNFDTPARTQHFRFGFDLPDLVLSAERVSSALGGRGRRRPFYLYVRCAAGVLNNNGGGGGI